MCRLTIIFYHFNFIHNGRRISYSFSQKLFSSKFSSNIFYCLCTTESTNNEVGLQVLTTLVTAFPLEYTQNVKLAEIVNIIIKIIIVIILLLSLLILFFLLSL